MKLAILIAGLGFAFAGHASAASISPLGGDSEVEQVRIACNHDDDRCWDRGENPDVASGRGIEGRSVARDGP